MSQEIERVSVAEDRYALWGVTINDYAQDGVAVDFETLMVNVATNRASIIEDEIEPLQEVVRKRNDKLKALGDVLSDLYAVQADFKSEAQGTDLNSGDARVTEANRDYYVQYFGEGSELFVEKDSNGYKMSKSNCEKALQTVKAEIDKLNNDNQLDMTRLQSLVSKRDESFTTASSMMSSISDTRSNTIKGIS